MKLFLLLALLMVNTISHAQIVGVPGRVVNDITKAGIPFAAIQVGNKYQTADSLGNFMLSFDYSRFQKETIVLSSVGYQTQKMAIGKLDTTAFLLVALLPEQRGLPDVVILSDKDYGRRLVKKAIAQLPANYTLSPFALKVFEDTRERINDSQYVFHDNAIIQTYFDPQKKWNESMQVQVLQNKQNQYYRQLKDTSKILRHWIDANREVMHSTMVYNLPDFINGHKLGNFTYHYKNRITYGNKGVFVVDFVSKKDTGFTGTLFIDTLSHAFAGIYYLKLKPKIYNAKDVLLSNVFRSTYNELRVNYAEQNGHWFFHDMQGDYRVYIKEKDKSISSQKLNTALFLLQLDTLQPKPIPYKNREGHGQQIGTLREGDAQNWEQVEDDLKIKTIREPLAIKPAATADSSGYKAVPPVPGWVKSFAGYVLNGGSRAGYGFNSNAFAIKNVQPSPGDVSGIVNYGFSIWWQFRLYRNLFVDANYYSGNFGIGKLNTTSHFYGLLYTLNLYRRRFYLLPSAGFALNRAKKGKNTLFRRDFWAPGAQLGYRLPGSSKLVFIGAKYNTKYSVREPEGVSLSPRRFYFSTGILFNFR